MLVSPEILSFPFSNGNQHDQDCAANYSNLDAERWPERENDCIVMNHVGEWSLIRCTEQRLCLCEYTVGDGVHAPQLWPPILPVEAGGLSQAIYKAVGIRSFPMKVRDVITQPHLACYHFL